MIEKSPHSTLIRKVLHRFNQMFYCEWKRKSSLVSMHSNVSVKFICSMPVNRVSFSFHLLFLFSFRLSFLLYTGFRSFFLFFFLHFLYHTVKYNVLFSLNLIRSDWLVPTWELILVVSLKYCFVLKNLWYTHFQNSSICALFI